MQPKRQTSVRQAASPRATLTELREAGAALVLYSTPCLFVAQAAMEASLKAIFADDGRLPETGAGRAVGVLQCTALLVANHEAAGIAPLLERQKERGERRS